MTFLPREKQVKIGDVMYKTRELKASERSILLFRTNELLGESISSYVEGFIGNIDQITAVGRILNKLSKNTTPEILNQFVKDTILTCVISPKSASDDTDTGYEMHFCEYYEDIPFVLWAIYDQNFGSIVKNLKKKLPDKENSTPKSSEKTETSDEEKGGLTPKVQEAQPQTTSPLQTTNF